MGEEALATLGEVEIPLACELEARMGVIQQFTPSIEALYVPNIDDSSKVVAAIRASSADVILVAMGNPQQELWLADNLKATGSQLGFGVGALFDFVSGHPPRAPICVRTARLEWLYRLVHEPRRMTRRYLVGIPLFLFRIFKQCLSGTPIQLTRSVRHS